MTNRHFYTWAYTTVRMMLAVLFLWSGFSKLMAPMSFAVLVGAFGIVPEGLVFPMAVLLPILEILLGIALIFDIRGSLGTITGLLLVFMAVLGYAIFMGFDVECGCFGPDDLEFEAFNGLAAALIRDVIILIGIIYLYVWRWCRSYSPVKMKILVSSMSFSSILFKRKSK